MPQMQIAVLVQDEGETVNQPQQTIGRCLGCRYAEETDADWLTCSKRGRVNLTFARQFHDCYESRTCEPGDYDDYRGEKI